MKSGILATTTLLVILGAVEQVQAQVNTDEDFESDVTELTDPSADAFVHTKVADHIPDHAPDHAPDQFAGNNKTSVNLAWQTDFGFSSAAISAIGDRAISSTITTTEELKPLSSVSAASTPDAGLDGDSEKSIFNSDQTKLISSGSKKFFRPSPQFRPHIPPRNHSPKLRSENFSFRQEHLRTALRNFSSHNASESGADFSRNLDANYPLSPSTANLEVALLSVDAVHEPTIPPLASATAYLPELHPERSVFNGYRWPAQGIMTSGYGWRWGRMHQGIDIAGPVGTPIVAAADGVVITSEWHRGGYGNFIKIEHPDGSITLYAHNSENRVQVGQVVKQGELIAFMGSTGYSTGPHLHFEIHLPGQGPVNPMVYLPSGSSLAHQW